MKKTTFFILGTIVGLLTCFALLYLSGSIFEYFGLRFYESESDQQRNFNVFLVVSIICSLITGYLFAKKFA
jgi:hypothetical protein